MSAHVFRQPNYMVTGSRVILVAILLGYRFAVKLLFVIALKIVHAIPAFN